MTQAKAPVSETRMALNVLDGLVRAFNGLGRMTQQP